MKKITMMAVAAMALSSAANADVYIHGRDPGNTYAKGFTQDYSYWGSYAAAYFDGGAKQAFNWDGASRVITDSTVVNAFNAGLLSRANIIRCHSAGCLVTARLIQLYGTGKVGRVVAGSSAEGGSELANISQPEPLTYDLQPGTARSFSHNSTKLTHHGGGSNCEPLGAGTWGSFFSSAVVSPTLPGEDDGAVSYHSTLGKAATGSYCDPDDWFCTDYGSESGMGWNGSYWSGGNNYSGHVIRAADYIGHSTARTYSGRGW